MNLSRRRLSLSEHPKVHEPIKHSLSQPEAHTDNHPQIDFDYIEKMDCDDHQRPDFSDLFDDPVPSSHQRSLSQNDCEKRSKHFDKIPVSSKHLKRKYSFGKILTCLKKTKSDYKKVDNLLENAESPCADTPPQMKVKKMGSRIRNSTSKIDLPVLKVPVKRRVDEEDAFERLEMRSKSDSDVIQMLTLNKSANFKRIKLSPGNEDDNYSKIDVDKLNLKERQLEKIVGMKKFFVRKKHSSGSMNYDHKMENKLFYVILKKSSMRKLGFSIVGGSDSIKGPLGIYVKNIMPDGEAAAKGNLRIGDEILSINQVSLRGITHNEALQMIKNAPAGDLTFSICRRVSS